MKRSVLSIIICFTACMSAQASVMKMSLKDAMSKRIVSVSGTSTGGYMGKCLSLRLTNNSNYNLDILVDPALIFKPDDSSYQDLVAVGNERLALKAHDCGDMTLQTFCGKSYAHSPQSQLHYRFRKQGDSNMIKTVTYIREHNLLNYIGQHAVWLFTNHHSLNNVYDSFNPEVSRPFVKFIASLLHVKVPDFYTQHKINNNKTGPVYVQKIEKVYVDINWNFNNARNLHVGIFKDNGSLYKEVTDNEKISAEGHSVKVEMDPAIFKDNKYYVRLYDDDNNIFVQKEVEM